MAACEVGREPARFVGTIAPDLRVLLKLLAKAGDRAQVSVVYEAGPIGYGLYRELCQRGYRCEIVAPSLIPRRPGDRGKNDRRDCARLSGHASAVTSLAKFGSAAEETRSMTPVYNWSSRRELRSW